MSEALPALAFGAINSVIALFGNPPPVIRSRTSTPVDRMVVGGGEGWGKRAASNFRRSTTFLADMPNSGIRLGYVQANIFARRSSEELKQERPNAVLVFLPPFVLAHERDHDALNFQLAGGNQIRVA